MQHHKPSVQLALLAVLSIGIMSGLIIYFQSHSLITDNPTLIQTEKISSTQGIGGKPSTDANVNQSTTKDSPTTNQTDKPGDQSSGQPTAPSTSKAPLSAVAPRQAEIAATIKQEYIYRAFVAPNDPLYASSWSLSRTNAQSAWNVTTGTPVTVAVIDTGYALQHEDLTNQWFINSGEFGMTSATDTCGHPAPVDRATNACDDDGNGYVDDWRGWNFSGGNNLPQAGSSSAQGIDAISHGTAVAGLLGAQTNNGKGIATYNWQVKVMPLQVLEDSGVGTTSDVVPAIYYAVDNGASVINMSLGGEYNDPALQTAIDYAYANDVVIVAAAGNCGTGTEGGCNPSKPGAMGYPALNNHVIAVGATDSTDARASFSSYGPGLDVVAPGSGTLHSPLINTSTVPYNYASAYSGSLYGTSFASPIVTGIVALIKSVRPSSSVDDIIAIVDGSATKVAGMNGNVYTNEYGHGVINTNTATIIGKSLTETVVATPKLGQTGDSRSEHSFSSGASMSSGCTVAPNTYCTVRIVNATTNYERFLPYNKADANGQTGWSWSGSILANGEWYARANQGETLSGTYLLFAK